MPGSELDAFVARHPWPAAMLAAGKPLEFLWRFEIAAPLERMWPVLIDTSRFNRALGLPEMHYEEREGRLHGTTINAGFRQTWVEVPWQWVHGREMLAVRDYSEGFARWVRAIYEVVDVRADAFTLLVYFGWIPRGWLGRMILRFGFPRLEADYRRVLGELAQSTRAHKVSSLFRVMRPALAPGGEQQLQAKIATLLAGGLPKPVVERLATHLRSGDELELARIQPKQLAQAWGVDTRELLRVALHATRAGMLDLSWDIVCPHCRGTRAQAATLSKIPGESRCDACDVEFDTRSESSVEVTFRVNPTIRKIGERQWCAAEPAQREHILVQRTLAPGETDELALELAAGHYRLRHRGRGPTCALELRAGASTQPLEWRAQLRGEQLRAPNPRLQLHNDGDAPLDFVLERAQWSEHALRPGDLLSLREFRDLFSEDYLASDVQLAVGMQTLLFTDMVGSTRFYASRGDADAFVQVRRHFGEIFEDIAAHDGVVVKTIGDAVMAAFVDARAAVRAAHALQQRFPATREDLDIRIRISINRGPCIAVRFNTDVDYFGNTVNIAAKLQVRAEAHEIAISRAVYDAPGVAEVLAELGVALEQLTLDLPALGGEIEVLRWRV
jgi:class 3 adenylate cyclase